MLIRHFPLWKRAPFLRLVIPFILGIAFAWYLGPPLITELLIGGFGFTGYCCTFMLDDYSRLKWNWICGAMLSVAIFSLGSIALHRQDIRNNPRWLGLHVNDSSLLLLQILNQPTDKQFYYSATAEIIHASNPGQPPPVGKLLLRIPKDSITKAPAAGDLVLTAQVPVLVPDNANPGAFNFQFYCLQQSITHQIQLRRNEFRLLNQYTTNSFQRWIASIQNKVLLIVRKYVPGKKQSGIAEALLIGYREDLDKSLVQSYANTGVVHIIAISGLHLGMLYGLLLLFLKPLEKLKIPSFVQLAFVLGGLWMFSLIAGASPSVLRSAVMFSFIAFGNSMNRKADIFNTLSASAFFLLWINPFYLWDLGFQLSYAAVLSIAIFQRPILLLLTMRNKFLEFTWSLVAISFAAQILTTPISIFQFHQQPVLFLFANAIAVPLSGFVLYIEILLLISSGLPWLAIGVGKIIAVSLQILNTVIERLDGSAIAVWNKINLSFVEMLLSYLIICSATLWIWSRKKKYGYHLLLWLFCFAGGRSLLLFEAGRQQKIVIYQLPSHTNIEFVQGRKFFGLMDENLASQNGLQNLQLEPSHNIFRMRRVDSLPGLVINYPFIFFRNKTCLLVSQKFDPRSYRKKIKVDLVIFFGNPRVSIEELRQIVDFGLIIWDGSNAAAKTNEWKSECDTLALRCHSTPIQGPFMLDF